VWQQNFLGFEFMESGYNLVTCALPPHFQLRTDCVQHLKQLEAVVGEPDNYNIIIIKNKPDKMIFKYLNKNKNKNKSQLIL